MHSKLITSVVAAALCLPASSLIAADVLDALQGEWTVKKTRDGQSISHVIELTKNKITFQHLNSENEIRLFARGTVKAERLGPFNVLKISNIETGSSAADAKAVDDERTVIYVLGDGTLTLGSNLDKQRENQQPSLDIYTRTVGGLEGKLIGKWNMEVTFGDSSRKYELRVAQAKGGLEAVIVSERSGEHKCRLASVKDGELLMELDRDIQGNEATFVYKAKLAGEKLSGTLVIKGREDEFSGKWTATK